MTKVPPWLDGLRSQATMERQRLGPETPSLSVAPKFDGGAAGVIGCDVKTLRVRGAAGAGQYLSDRTKPDDYIKRLLFLTVINNYV